MKISYLGPKGTNCYEACCFYNKDNNYEMIPAKTITEAIELLLNNNVDKAIVPIENSIKGTVLEALDNIIENEDLFIEKEIIIDISHYLLGLKSNNVKKLYSHPQALGQCKNYIKNNLKDFEIIEMQSTANAAEIVSSSKEGLCIANKVCSELYNLEIIDDNIQDKSNNKTRFFVLSKNEIHNNSNIKVSIILSTKNIPGALYQILGLFNTFEINMTKIESRPSEKELGDYLFWIEADLDELNEKTNVFFDILKNKCSYFRILGIY